MVATGVKNKTRDKNSTGVKSVAASGRCRKSHPRVALPLMTILETGALLPGHAQAVAESLPRRHHFLTEQAGFDPGIGINFEKVINLAAFHGELLFFHKESTTERAFSYEYQVG